MDSGYLYNSVEEGFPARDMIPFYQATPAAATLISTVVPCDFVVEKLDLTLTDCGDGGKTDVDVNDDGTTIFAAVPSVANTDTNGTTYTFVPDPDLATIAAGSTLTVVVEAAGTNSTHLNGALWGYSRKRMP